MPRIYKYKSLLDHILDNVLISDGCWLWKGRINRHGYGFISVRIAPQESVHE